MRIDKALAWILYSWDIHQVLGVVVPLKSLNAKLRRGQSIHPAIPKVFGGRAVFVIGHRHSVAAQAVEFVAVVSHGCPPSGG